MKRGVISEKISTKGRKLIFLNPNAAIHAKYTIFIINIVIQGNNESHSRYAGTKRDEKNVCTMCQIRQEASNSRPTPRIFTIGDTGGRQLDYVSQTNTDGCVYFFLQSGAQPLMREHTDYA